MNDIFILPLVNSDELCLVDSDKAEILSRFRWYKNGSYISRSATYRRVYLARQLLDAEKGLVVDHKNRNTLDNRVCNLRIATASQNGANRKKSNYRNSIYRGVYKDNSVNKWKVEIYVNKKSIYGGHYMSEDDAGRRANELYLEHFGEFANLNIIENS